MIRCGSFSPLPARSRNLRDASRTGHSLALQYPSLRDLRHLHYALRRPGPLIPGQYFDTLFRLDDHAHRAEFRSVSWTSGFGCGALALGTYEAAFRENEIDDAVLPSLTALGP